jgi:uncharacterized protein
MENIRKKAEHLFEHASGSHNWDHTLRVASLCERIGSVEKADMDVLLAAAYLHDIGRCHQDGSNGQICHAEKGAELAIPLLTGSAFSEAQKENVIHCIKTHRFRSGHPPETIEAKILFDADKLDAIGAVGVARAFQFAGELGARLHNPGGNIENTSEYSKEDTGYREFKVKLCKVKGRILTGEGRRLAEERHDFMEDFFNRFIQEVNGER